jgi:hypothetical protein
MDTLRSLCSELEGVKAGFAAGKKVRGVRAERARRRSARARSLTHPRLTPPAP